MMKSMPEVINFQQHLRAVSLAGQSAASAGQLSDEVPETDADLETVRKEAYAQGEQAAQQKLQAKIDAAQVLQQKLFKRLEAAEQELTEAVEAALPDLIVEAVRQIIPKWVPSAEDVEHVLQEMLSGLESESGPLEIHLNEADKEHLDTLHDGSWNDFKGTKLIVDKSLSSGECVVFGRFGRVDGRFASKLNHLKKNLSE